MLGFYDLVKERLVARCPALLQVETAASAEAAVEMLTLAADVTALVSPLSDEAATVRGSGLKISQVETETFGVTLAMVFPAGFTEFEAARDQVKNALRGWLAEGLDRAVEYAGGRTLQYSLGQAGGRWLHLLRFRFTTTETYEVSQ